MKKENIKIEGYIGTWYVIDTSIYNGEIVYLLEHEEYGDEVNGVIVNQFLNVIHGEVYNGFDDLDELDGKSWDYWLQYDERG